MARSNANVAIKTRLKEGVEKSGPTFGRPLGDVAVDEGMWWISDHIQTKII